VKYRRNCKTKMTASSADENVSHCRYAIEQQCPVLSRPRLRQTVQCVTYGSHNKGAANKDICSTSLIRYTEYSSRSPRGPCIVTSAYEGA